MTEEEYFRKNYPNSCYGDKPLSPYWDYFQDGVEFGERESENKIAELEAEVNRLKLNEQLAVNNGKNLLKEKAELKVRVGLSIECDKAQKNGELCLGYGGDEDEPCEQCKNCIKCECGYYQLGETEKDEQLKQWKDEWQEQVQKATDEGYARTLQTIQLSKAKELLKMALDWQGRCGNGHPTWQEVCAEIKQFLSEVEKC